MTAKNSYTLVGKEPNHITTLEHLLWKRRARGFVVCYATNPMFSWFALALGCLATINVHANEDSSSKPNILFIMIDDLGWMDLACQGNNVVKTPNIDRLAEQGMRFTNAYAAAPVCSPTRAAIMTGLSPARLKITNHTPDQPRFTPKNARLLPAKMHNHLDSKYVTIAEQLKTVGYSTAFLGKWHLSGPGKGQAEFGPTNQGFDLNIGGCGYGGPPTFFDPYRIPNLSNRRKGEYLPDRLADEAIHVMRTKKAEPFAIFLWNYTVHWPMEAPQALLDKYQNHKGPGLNDFRYGAMIEGMDASIGRVLNELDRLRLSDNTVVIFTSDNGGFGGVADNRPLRAEKGYLYEGGIRIPMIVRWPGIVRPETICDLPVVSMDHFPTISKIAGSKSIPSDLDGESLLPLFKGGARLKRDAIYFHYPNYAFHQSNRLGSAIRQGHYKLIENFDDGSVELYDLDKDLGEIRNLAEERAEIAEKLRNRLVLWRASVSAEMPIVR